jgi:hypoxanthine-DNA glycosylase
LEKIIEYHPLAPFLPVNAKILILGSFPPPLQRWSMNFYYPNFQNDFWRIMGIVFHENQNFFIHPDKKAFNELLIRDFCLDKGIAISDTAKAVIREKNNASDNSLSICELMNIQEILQQIPECKAIVTTGQKATSGLSEILGIQEVALGESKQLNYSEHELLWFRLPSTSRAYPKPLLEKAQVYTKMFQSLNFTK